MGGPERGRARWHDHVGDDLPIGDYGVIGDAACRQLQLDVYGELVAAACARLEPPGFAGLNYGRRTPLTTLLGQLCYGAILGGAYDVSGS